MSGDKETRDLLIESAKKEFSEKGYMKASLRKICADAGVTTGALYFFFEDKENLFGEIVDKPLRELISILQSHFAEDEAAMEQPYSHEDGDHDEFVNALIRHIYGNYDAFILLLTKSQGSKYEGCVDEVVDTVEQFYLAISGKIGAHFGSNVNKYMLHWLTHIIIDSFIHLITHESDENKALVFIRKIMDFILVGWQKAVLDN